MHSSWFDSTLAWIGAHPVLAGAVIFAIAFCDAVIVLGAIVPALPLLFAVGVMIGLGKVSGPYALACAALGAFVGDALSYWIGKRWGAGLRETGPFRKFPQFLEKGEVLFRRNAIKAIFVARYVGAIRPFVPAIAGMSGMPLQRFLLPSALAAVSWAALFLGPGWLLGEAYDAVAAVAGRLGLVVGLLLAALALVWAVVIYGYRWFAAHADSLIARGLDWSHRHPKLGRYSEAIFDPTRRESVPLALLAACLIGIGWAWFALLAVVVGHGDPLGIDVAVHDLMLALRNPLADYPMAAIASLADWPVLLPPVVLVTLYLAWRRRWMAAAHWLAALAFGLALTTVLGASVDVARPPSAGSGFGFPSIAVTMATITFGFFAVLVGRELPGRTRVWPYLVSGVTVTLIGFARLYLGAHWLSDIVGGMLFGIVWLLVLGIAYRRRMTRSFWMKPLAWLFYGAFAIGAAIYAPQGLEAKLAKFEAPPTLLGTMPHAQWAAQGWRALPARRNEFDDQQRWPLDVQVAGPLQPLQARLEAAGWRVQPQAGWTEALQLLRPDLAAKDAPVLPATLDTRGETLLMLRAGSLDDEIHALRLWPAPVQLQDDGVRVPLWIGSAQTLRFKRVFKFTRVWRTVPGIDPALDAVREAADAFAPVQSQRPRSGLPVLRIDVRPPAPAGAPAARADRPPAAATGAASD